MKVSANTFPRVETDFNSSNDLGMVKIYYSNLIQGMPLNPTAIDSSRFTNLIERIAQDLHQGNLKAEDLDEELIQQTYSELTKAVDEAWKGRYNFGDNADADRTVLAMQRNIFRFSQAKSFAQLKELNSLLTDNGKLREWADFKKEALALNQNYNRNYLQAEYQTARQAGHHARNWQGYFKDSDLFPNLEYKTTGDALVRQEHAALNGIIKPVNDPFWDQYYPPNGWRCRCYVQQTDSSTTPDQKIPPSQDVKPEFKVNVGKTGAVFGNTHPYFVLAASGKKELQKAFEVNKEFAPYFTAYRYKGNTVKISPFADASDALENFNSAKIIVDNQISSVKIRPHINLSGKKNPEYLINQIKGDHVVPSTKNIKRGIANSFNDKLGKNKQLAEEKNTFLVINLSEYHLNNNAIEAIASQSWSRFNQYKNISFLIFIHDQKAIKINRELLEKGYVDYKYEINKMQKED